MKHVTLTKHDTPATQLKYGADSQASMTTIIPLALCDQRTYAREMNVHSVVFPCPQIHLDFEVAVEKFKGVPYDILDVAAKQVFPRRHEFRYAGPTSVERFIQQAASDTICQG